MSSYEAHLRPWFAVFRDGEIALDSITPDHIERFIEERRNPTDSGVRPVSPSTIKKDLLGSPSERELVADPAQLNQFVHELAAILDVQLDPAASFQKCIDEVAVNGAKVSP